MKKLTALSLALLLCLGAAALPARAAGAGPFSDVPASHWAYRYVVRAYNEGVVTGTYYDPQTGDRRFSPDKAITLAEWTVILARAFYGEETAGREERNWYNRQQEVLEELGIYDGIGSVEITGTATRYQMAVMIVNTMREQGAAMPDEARLRAAEARVGDLDRIPARFREAVLICYCLGIIKGTDANVFAGDSPMDRSQAATVYCRMADALGPERTAAESSMTGWWM